MKLLDTLVLYTLLTSTLSHTINKSSLISYPTKPRIFILSDISNEPDDKQSLTRYLLYSNQFQTEGIVAVTSTWLRNEVHPEDMLQVIDAYGNVTENLNRHVSSDSMYPSAEEMRRLVRKGPQTYGMTAVGNNTTLSEGAELLLSRLQDESPDPLWVLAWGGTNVLAEVLYKISQTFPNGKAAALRSKLRVYTISDQDDTGAWIRHRFPDIFYISSTHGWNQYGLATWVGISGEEYYSFDEGGPDGAVISQKWLNQNIQIGPYGKSAYPDYEYIMEGDTPTFLYLIQNGLGVTGHPEYGSWGGRYMKVNPSTALNFNYYSDAADCVVGQGNETYKSNQATIWRWRRAYQNDFAARMQWTLSANGSTSKANHHPVISINGSRELQPVRITAQAGSTITLDARDTIDPDGDELSFKWFQYKEPGSDNWNVAQQVPALNVSVSNEGQLAQVRIPEVKDSCNGMGSNPSGCWLLHLVLEVTDNGYYALTSYRRVLIQTMDSDVNSGV